jgi:hypothetical protein
MVTRVPPIFTGHAITEPLSWPARALAGCFGFGALTLLALSAWLHPDPAGVGTHHQLGLKPCGLLLSTGMPCPTCGMTTSFALFAHGRLLASFLNQPMGFVTAIGACATVWIGLYLAVTGKPVGRLANRLPLRGLVLAAVGFLLAAWVWKIVSIKAGWNVT